MNIGERICELRKNKGLSQEELAEQLGVSRQSVSKWETGASTPDTDKALAMSRIFGVTADFLLTGEYNNPDLASGSVVYNKGNIVDGTRSVPENPHSEKTTDETDIKKKKTDWRIIVAIVLAVCILLGLLAAVFFGKDKNGLLDDIGDELSVKKEYPCVLVHGMGGWGEGAEMNKASPYWGASSGSISAYLRTQEIEVAEATVGPFSSAWDRACELYAQMTGTRVDYGEAHSKAHNHARFGRTYTEPLVKEWNKKHKINLIGHSFGGNTIRLFTSIMEYGSQAEMNAGGEECSPFFKGGKGDYINSVTTLASPHNGSTLFYVVDHGLIIETVLAGLKVTDNISGYIGTDAVDFQLEHFGITSGNDNTVSQVNVAFSNGTDNSFYDLSPHGAKVLNETIKTVDSVYYFSYVYCTTEKSPLSNNHIPTSSTMGVLVPTATLIGRYRDESREIDNSWLPNDGLVNVVSAKYPLGEEFKEYTDDTKVKPGCWYVFPTITGDHGTAIGMNGNADAIRSFYMDHLNFIKEL